MKTNTTILTLLVAAATVTGCSSIDGDQVSVSSATEVNENMTFQVDPITKSRDLQTASYWATCKEQNDGVGYRYRTSVYENGKAQTQLYIRLKSSRGAYAINKAFDEEGQNYAVKVYKPETKSDSVVYEHFALAISPEQLKAASQSPVNLHLVGDNHNCTIVVEQPVSYAFDANLNALLATD